MRDASRILLSTKVQRLKDFEGRRLDIKLRTLKDPNVRPIWATLDTLAHITPTSIPCGHIYVLLPKWCPLSTHMS